MRNKKSIQPENNLSKLENFRFSKVVRLVLQEYQTLTVQVSALLPNEPLMLSNYLIKMIERATGDFNVKNKALHICIVQIHIKKCVHLCLGSTVIKKNSASESLSGS
jgi:hypothetical protein